MKVIATTDVRLREQWHDKGAVFVVGDADDEVDATTAGQWMRLGWAEEVAEGDTAPAAAPVPAKKSARQ